VPHRDVLDAPHWDDDDVLAVGAVGPPEDLDELRVALHAGISPECESLLFTTFTGESFLKIRHAGENKGTSVIRMAAERGLAVEETVAIGDWTNDIPMLRTAGLSFSMADSGAEVHEAATHALDASRHEGGAIAEVAAKVWGL
jgi:hydroxymethylpyrimidine pyrophosphatase-like HAD family hydrolase